MIAQALQTSWQLPPEMAAAHAERHEQTAADCNIPIEDLIALIRESATEIMQCGHCGASIEARQAASHLCTPDRSTR